MKLARHIILLGIIANLAACATQATDETCLDDGTNFELSKGLIAPDRMTEAMAAADATVAGLGYKPSPDMAQRFEPLAPTPPIKYIQITDLHGTVYRDNANIPSGPTRIKFDIYGSCGPAMRHERKKFMDSIKAKLKAALQPYATEDIAVFDSAYEYTD